MRKSQAHPGPEVIDLTEAGQLSSLVDELTATLTITETQVLNYHTAKRALASSAHRADKLLDRVFSPRGKPDTVERKETSSALAA